MLYTKLRNIVDAIVVYGRRQLQMLSDEINTFVYIKA